MGDRHAVQQSLNSLLSKLDDADPDMRYMSLNDLYVVLNNPSSTYLAHDQFSSAKLAEGLLKALDDQHGDVQNQALKWSDRSLPFFFLCLFYLTFAFLPQPRSSGCSTAS